MRPIGAAAGLDARIAGPFRQRYAQELFRNSGLFPLANLLLELLLEGPKVFSGPDVYVLVAAGLVQAWAIARWEHTPSPRRLLGNLVGPAAYTLIESLFEGLSFFAAPNHIAYWCFALAIGALQAARERRGRGPVADVLVVLESVARAGILFVMYSIFEVLSDRGTFSLDAFFSGPSHVFLGVSAGLESLSAQGYLALLRETPSQLKRYSEWLLGSPGVMGYDVIGDTVNTAKRIEGAALDPGTRLGERREVLAKGKEAPIEVFALS